ncbi:MAG: hypothetical protein IJ605_05310, partial [Prevotella sp.]|nr:hypothetical protein [Prevotella sp.]
IPCGTKSTYLTSATIAGDDVLSELNYTASAAPANYHVIYVDQKAEVKQGGTLPLTVTVSNNSSEIRMFAYADWDRDGVFEASQEISGGTATFEVPAEAKLGQCRFRVRVTETDTEGSEDDVIGTCYDFLVNVVDSSKEIEWTVEVNNPARGIASGEEITNGEEKFLKATVKPIGDAVFKGWKLMHSYFKGEIIGTDTEIEVPLTQSLRLVAVLEPNTKITETVKETTYSTMYYSNVALKVPEGVTAYTYKLEGGELAKSKTYNTDDIIPAGEPVVLYDNDETIRNYDFPIVTSNATPDPDNLLLGFDEAQTTVGPRGETSGYKFYKFSFKGRDANNKPQNVGFYYGASKGAAFTSAAHKAYLAVSQDVTGSAKQFLSIPEDFNETTGIQTIEDARADAAVYTLQGIKVNTNGGKLPKGIYIINNKKEIVK